MQNIRLKFLFYSDAINLLGEQLAGLFGNLFGNVGKRDLTSVLNANIGQVRKTKEKDYNQPLENFFF